MVNKATAGTDYTTNAYWTRVLQSIPASYTVWKDGANYRAECNFSGGDDIPANTNAATVIQNAIDGLGSGGRVHLREGIYNITTELGMGNNIWLSGAGIGNTILYEPNNTNLVRILRVGKTLTSEIRHHCTVTDMTLDGNKANNPTATNNILSVEESNNIWLDRLEFLNAQNNALYAYNDTYLWLTNCSANTVNTNQAFGIRDVSKSHFDNLTAKDCGSCGFAFNHLEDSTISNIYCTGTKTNFKTSYGTLVTDVTDGCTFSNITIRNAGTTVGYPAMHLTYTKNCSFSNLQIDDGYDGIDLSICDNIQINNGRCYNANQVGVFIRDSCNGISLSDFEVDTTGTYGICIDGVRCNVHDCTVKSAANTVALSLTTGTYNWCHNNHWIAQLIQNGSVTNRFDGIARAATSVDLSGAAVTLPVFHTEVAASILSYTLLYTEASSADAGITLKLGKETDDDYFYTGTSETDKAQWYTKSAALTEKTLAAGDTVLFNSAGGKVGTGEIMCIIDYALGG